MRIGIVNDVPAATEVLRLAVASRPDLSVAWTAVDGAEAVALCARDLPDLVLMDLLMPRMNGVEATRRIMRDSPCAILVVTFSIETNMGLVFEAMGAGALDAVDTPLPEAGRGGLLVAPLLAKIDTVGKLVRPGLPPAAKARAGSRASSPSDETPLVAIGSSAGGPQALATVLSAFPADFPASIVIVQHLDERFAAGLARWLGGQCRLPVGLARPGERLERGKVTVAGTNDHLILTSAAQYGITAEPQGSPYRPSIDVFFHSLVQHARSQIVGVLLTGMGRDGALGLKALRDARMHTIAQDQHSSAVYGMPKAAAELLAAVEILPLSGIAPAILHQVTSAPHPQP